MKSLKDLRKRGVREADPAEQSHLGLADVRILDTGALGVLWGSRVAVGDRESAIQVRGRRGGRGRRRGGYAYHPEAAGCQQRQDVQPNHGGEAPPLLDDVVLEERSKQKCHSNGCFTSPVHLTSNSLFPGMCSNLGRG